MTATAHLPSGLSKATWTEDDFLDMGWHDCTIHALRVAGHGEDEGPPRLVLDLDYIVRWIQPVAPEPYFTFWIAPATLVFDWPTEIRGRFGPLYDRMELADLHRLDPLDGPPGHIWHLDGQEFDFYVRSVGYRQYIRSEPQHVAQQVLTAAGRGGLSFAEVPFT